MATSRTPYWMPLAAWIASCGAEDAGRPEDGGLDGVHARAVRTMGLEQQALDTNWLRGASCTYGTFGCNACVPDVEARFDSAASGSRNLRHAFYFAPNSRSLTGLKPDAFDVADHIQSVARIPGSDDERWLAMTRNARDLGDAAFYLFPFDQISSHGDAWKWAYRRTESHPTAKSYHYYRIPGFNHAGGTQALGEMFFVAAECDSGVSCTAAIRIYDVRDPAQVVLLDSLLLDGSQGELENGTTEFSSRAAAVGAARLLNGQTLLIIRGREADNNLWFFRSDTSTIRAVTSWTFLNSWIASGSDEPWEAWENVNLVTECDTGELYFVGMGTTENKSYLYHLGYRDGQIVPEYMNARGLNTSSPLTSTRAGSGVHITPNGHFVSYVMSRFPIAEIDEFRYHGAHLD